jgi:hypothetical protein
VQGPRPQATHRPDAAGGIKHHTAQVAITRDHLPPDALPMANFTPLVFPEKSAGRVSRPAQPEPQNIPRQTINNWPWSLSRLKKLAGFSPSQTPANYSTGYKARRSPNATIAKHVPADLIAVANPATPRFSREIRRSCFLTNATGAQKPSKTTHKLSAVDAVAGPKTSRFRAEPTQPSPKPAHWGSAISLAMLAEIHADQGPPKR